MPFFWDNFSNFFSKTVGKKGGKGEKYRSSHLKIFWEQGVLEVKKKKLAGLDKNLGNFVEIHIWMSSSVVKLQPSLQLYH